MEDKQKLTVAILGAIIAYLQAEQLPSVTPEVRPQAVNRHSTTQHPTTLSNN